MNPTNYGNSMVNQRMVGTLNQRYDVSEILAWKLAKNNLDSDPKL